MVQLKRFSSSATWVRGPIFDLGFASVSKYFSTLDPYTVRYWLVARTRTRIDCLSHMLYLWWSGFMPSNFYTCVIHWLSVARTLTSGSTNSLNRTCHARQSTDYPLFVCHGGTICTADITLSHVYPSHSLAVYVNMPSHMIWAFQPPTRILDERFWALYAGINLLVIKNLDCQCDRRRGAIRGYEKRYCCRWFWEIAILISQLNWSNIKTHL